MDTKKVYPPSIGFWPTKSGNGYSTPVNEKLMETLKKVELGGRLYLKEIMDAKSEKAPTFEIVVFPKKIDGDTFGNATQEHIGL